MKSQLNLGHFVDLTQCLHGPLLESYDIFSLVGPRLGGFLSAVLEGLGVTDCPVVEGHVLGHAVLEGPVYVAKGARIEPGAYIQGPCYIGPEAEVRHGAYIRKDVYVGPKAVCGHTTELKNALLLDDAKAAHFAYIGNGILGRHVNLGAGTKLANLPFRRKTIRVLDPFTGKALETGLTKFSAILGDYAQTGCNSVLSPGTLLMPESVVGPCKHFRGTLKKGQAFT